VALAETQTLPEGRRNLPRTRARRDVDAVGGQLARAKAAVASRYAAVVRQETDLLNADAKLRTLINDPQLLLNRCQELIPVQQPLREPCPLSFQDSLIVALNHRPEINEDRTKLKRVCVQQTWRKTNCCRSSTCF